MSGGGLGASGGVWGVLDGVWMVFETLFPIWALCAPPGHTGIQNPGSIRVKKNWVKKKVFGQNISGQKLFLVKEVLVKNFFW